MARYSKDPAVKQMGRRLAEELVRTGIKASEIARQLGRSRQLISHWTQGRAQITTPDLMRLRKLGIDSEYVTTGTRWGLSSPPGKFTPQRFMPLLTPAQILAVCKGKLDVSELEKTVPALGPCSDLAFSFDVFDAAMTPNFTPGTRVSVDPKIVPGRDSGVLVALLTSDDVLFRRLGYTAIGAALRERTGGPPLGPPFTLIADSPDWPAPERQVRAADRPVFAGTLFQAEWWRPLRAAHV